jgi:5-methylcytosine-specific restriction enzyme subunit McrC
VEEEDCVYKSRALLRKLIQKTLSLKPRQASVTALERFDAPLSEWVMSQFLFELDHLVKRGMRFDYHRIEEEQRFLRGQLNVIAQMRQPLSRQHQFQIRHDVFLPNRAENRLLKLALEQVAKATEDASNWSLANELRLLLCDIPTSIQVRQDFHAWGDDRLMAHYRAVKPWCSLILNKQMPLAVAGQCQGVSLLFPMEKIFERYVEIWLRDALSPDAKLKAQAASKYLCMHDNHSIFRLEPDLFIKQELRCWVLDTKWKRLDASVESKKYGLNQDDFYQLLAYGKQYLKGQGEMAMIYPRWSHFQSPLMPFEFDSQLKLWILPFDMDDDVMMGANLLGLPLKDYQ